MSRPEVTTLTLQPRPQAAGGLAYARQLTVRLAGTTVLRGLDLSLNGGERVAVTGPNGAGKTTLLRVLATLQRPAAGELEVLGWRWPGLVPGSVRRAISLIGHEAALHPELTLSENLRLVARLAGVDVVAADRALEEVGLAAAATRRVGACSEGMKRRAELARVRLTRPRLLLLDEPHAALDPDARLLVGRVIDEVARAGGAVVAVTHDPAGLAGVVDRVLVLRRGRLLDEEGRP